MSLRLAALLLCATVAAAELRLGPAIAVGEGGRDVRRAQNSRPAIATNGTDTFVFWATAVLNRPGVLVAARLGSNEVVRLADSVRVDRVAAFAIDGVYVVVFIAANGELQALRWDGAGAIETLSLGTRVNGFAAASNGRDIFVAGDTGNEHHATLVRGDLSQVRELGRIDAPLVAVASDGAGFAILSAHEATLSIAFFDGKELGTPRELLRSGGTFPSVALAAFGGVFTAAWQQCVDDTCAVRGGRFTREEFLGAMQFDAPRKRKPSRELGAVALSNDALVVAWGESDEYERLLHVLARRVVGEETLDPVPLELSTESVALLADEGRLVIADALVRAASVADPLAKPWPAPKLEVLSYDIPFESADALVVAGERVVLVRKRLEQLPPYGSAAATLLERGRARDLPIPKDLYGASAASDGRRAAIIGFDARANLVFQAEGQPPRVLVPEQEWSDRTAIVWAGDRYVVAWTAHHHLRLLDVDRHGKPLGEPRDAAKMIVKADEPVQRTPSFARGNGETLLVWEEGNIFYDGERLLRAMRLGQSEEPLVLSRKGTGAAAAWNGRAYAIVWHEPDDPHPLRGVILRGTSVTPFTLSDSTGAQEPALVAIASRFVVACRDYDGQTLTRLIEFNEEGKLLATVATPAGGEHFMRPYLAAARRGTLVLFHTNFVPAEPYGGTFRPFVHFVEMR